MLRRGPRDRMRRLGQDCQGGFIGLDGIRDVLGCITCGLFQPTVAYMVLSQRPADRMRLARPHLQSRFMIFHGVANVVAGVTGG